MIPDYPRLNFPAVKLRISQRGEQMTVWDPLRGIYLVLTPEEWVRRHLIGFLISHCGAQPMRIVQEYAVAMNGSPQRADVVVVDDRARPLMLVECKAAGIGIDRQVLAQVMPGPAHIIHMPCKAVKLLFLCQYALIGIFQGFFQLGAVPGYFQHFQRHIGNIAGAKQHEIT